MVTIKLKIIIIMIKVKNVVNTWLVIYEVLVPYFVTSKNVKFII